MRFFLFLFVLSAFVSCGEKSEEKTTDLCASVTCDEWKECNPQNGNCETKENRCSNNWECSGVQLCDENHNCVNPENPCEGQSCSNFGVCAIINNTAKCFCEAGYKEEGLNCVDIDECVNNLHNCPDGFTCENTIGGFICNEIPVDLCENVTCDEWELCNSINGNCETKENRCSNNGECSGTQICDINHNCVNPVNPCEGQSCSNFGVCAIINNNAKCFCEAGYKEDGLTCVDIDECEENLNNCDENANCINTNGDFICECKNGYFGNGLLCLDIDECEENIDNCSENANCINLEGRYECQCKSGFSGNGIECDDINECINPLTNFCLRGYECLNTTGSYDCDSICGDNYLTVEEQCDISKLRTATCESLNYSAGDLSCNSSCEFNTSHCRLTKQWGTNATDTGNAVTVDNNGNVYVIGTVFGSEIDGNNLIGLKDAFLTKYDNTGLKLWTKQWGTNKNDIANAITVENNGNIFVTGTTSGNFQGYNFAVDNIFLTKFDESGNILWNKQYGSNTGEEALGIKNDRNGYIYITGFTYGALNGNQQLGNEDVYLIKLDNDGTVIWTKQVGSSGSDKGTSLGIDSSGNIYVTGYSNGNFDGNISFGANDLFIIKYNSTGAKQWSKQYGNQSQNVAKGITINNSNDIFITGFTEGDLDSNISTGNYDIFIVKYNSAGERGFTKRFGSIYDDTGLSITTDANRNIFVTGYVKEALGQNQSFGIQDIFLSKFDDRGNDLWHKQWGTSFDDIGNSVIADINGNVYVTGYTSDSLDGNTRVQGYDVFLSKYESE